MSKQILLLTQQGDAHADYIIPYIEKRGFEPVLLRTEEYPKELALSLGVSGSSSSVLLDGHALDPRSVWYRRPRSLLVKNRDVPVGVEEFVAKESALFIEMLLSEFRNGVRWISHPFDLQRAAVKTSQLRHAGSFTAMKVPETLVTNNPEEALRFCQKYNWNVVSKTLGPPVVRLEDGRLVNTYARKLSEDKVGQLQSIRVCPTILQECIDVEKDFRITVIGSKLFAFELAKTGGVQALDWRSLPDKNLIPKDAELPKDVAGDCLRLVQSFNLPFSTMDVVLSREGEYFFLDLNPNGQWLWLELDQRGESKQAMSDYFSDFLCGLVD